MTFLLSDWLAKARQKLNSAAQFTDSLDIVECVMAVEEVFDVSLPDETVENLSTPRILSQWLIERIASNEPNKQASELLRTIATRDNRPELGTTGHWRRQQVEAVVLELIRNWTSTKLPTLDSSFKDDNFTQ